MKTKIDNQSFAEEIESQKERLDVYKHNKNINSNPKKQSSEKSPKEYSSNIFIKTFQQIEEKNEKIREDLDKTSAWHKKWIYSAEDSLAGMTPVYLNTINEYIAYHADMNTSLLNEALSVADQSFSIISKPNFSHICQLDPDQFTEGHELVKECIGTIADTSDAYKEMQILYGERTIYLDDNSVDLMEKNIQNYHQYRKTIQPYIDRYRDKNTTALWQDYFKMREMLMRTIRLEVLQSRDPLYTQIELNKLADDFKTLRIFSSNTFDTLMNYSDLVYYDGRLSSLQVRLIVLQTDLFIAFPPTQNEFDEYVKKEIEYSEYIQSNTVSRFNMYNNFKSTAQILGFTESEKYLDKKFKDVAGEVTEYGKLIRQANNFYDQHQYNAAWDYIQKAQNFLDQNNLTLGNSKLQEERQTVKYLENADILKTRQYINDIINKEEQERGFSKEKSSFFTNANIKYYHLLIRNAYDIYSQKPDASSFSELINATEKLRARTFKEKYSADTQFDLATTQKKLNQNEAIIGYTDTGKYYLVYVITDKTYQVHTLNTITEIKKLIKNIKPNLETPESSRIALENDLKKLSKFLISPIDDQIKNKSTIYLLTDTELNYIPFDILSKSVEMYIPLLQSNAIMLHPSIAYVKKNNQLSKSKKFFALANPTFSTYEYGGMDIKKLNNTTRNASADAYFTPLQETEEEIKNISRFFPKNSSKLVTGKNASLSALKKIPLDEYNYLHFATHGILGYELPGVTDPALVLSSENGKNTFLTTSELKKLHLNADMTVLSACNTGSGKYSTGEGVMGIGQAFMAAGSKNVVMSLWPVPSQETVQLMSAFYEYINQGKSPSEALREAKLDLIRNNHGVRQNNTRGIKRKSSTQQSLDTEIHPFYWAPFVIIGS